MPLSSLEQKALAALDEQGLMGAFRDLVRIPSITGQESAARPLGNRASPLSA